MTGLPVRPVRLEGESLGSWLRRIATIYEIDVLEMLGQWRAVPILIPGTKARAMPSLDSVLRAIDPRRLQRPLHLADDDLGSLSYSKDDWVLRAVRHTPICALCWRDDLASGRGVTAK
jgi:hypothetical protein